MEAWCHSAGGHVRSTSTLPSSAIPGYSAQERTFTTTTTTEADGYAPTAASAQDPNPPEEMTPYFPHVGAHSLSIQGFHEFR